ncbi:hypothetical protein [Thalassomonas sp. RHCl1]|uniref:hypothetical protein n=1 Tax=Thalassomonas sp. RHCl1 TaxID=2995320 RepID=UPI00248CBF12|nr:hypothetical protein [Thalassomonas sp. RHCl1]
MTSYQDNNLANMAKHGFLIKKQCIDPVLFNNIDAIINKLILKNYNTGHTPLRAWWQDDQQHFTKIDQAHHASQGISDFIQSLDLTPVLHSLFTHATTCQLWASTVYLCPPGENTISAIGLHNDADHTPFIKGGYYTAWLPLNPIENTNCVLVNGSHFHKIDEKFCDALNADVNQVINEITSKYGNIISEFSLTQGDVLFVHSSCLRSILPNPSAKAQNYLVLYFRTENNPRVKNENHFGMCDQLENLALSPIIFHRKKP